MREAELEIARDIQLGLLPPAYYQNRNATIDAYMLPAKEVGGDLYDYQILESGEIYLTVADVSGKGVSAALFMSRALTLLHQYAGLGMSPAKLMEAFNNTLAEQNPNKLFITTFVARYNPKTGELTYTNAGHNPPYILAEELVCLDGAHGMAVGIFGGVTYEETTVALRDGDALFAYTDGVNEAENQAGEFFSTEALEVILRRYCGAKKANLLQDVREALALFAHGAEQSDDITMLLLRAQHAYHRELSLAAQVEQLTAINEAIDAVPDLPLQTNLDLKLMAEEMFVNICSYAYTETGGEVTVTLDIADEAVMTFADSGQPYDPTQEVLNIDDYDHNHTVGGLGKFITFQMADAYAYRYEDGKNILQLTKKIIAE